MVKEKQYGESRQPGAHLHLDVDVENLKSAEGDRIGARDQGIRSYFFCGIVGV